MFPIRARFVHVDGGWPGNPGLGIPGEGEKAAEVLTPGEAYTVRRLDVGRSSSRLILWDFPDREFNTVLFEPVASDLEFDDDEPMDRALRSLHAHVAAMTSLADRGNIAAARMLWDDDIRRDLDDLDLAAEAEIGRALAEGKNDG